MKNIQVDTADKNGRKKAAERDDKNRVKFMVNSSSCNNLEQQTVLVINMLL